MSLASLEIEFIANIARLRQDLDEVRGMFSRVQSHVEGTVGKLNSILGALGLGLSIAAFGSWMKAAIDAGDQMKEFSQKTGVAVADVAGLQLAFQQGNVGSEELGKSIAKLSKNMAEGSEAFKAIGVETRNSDGSLRNVKDVLYDVADATAAMNDGAAKSALLQEIFGKSAAALIPTLNEGSAGLRAMADMAERLGLSMSAEAAENADKFNDTMELLGDSTNGIARQVMAELLPTLNSMAGAMLEGATQGDMLKNTASAIAVVLKSLYTVFAVVSEYLTQVGKNFGALAAAIVAVMSGDIAGATQIVKERMSDMATDVAGRAKSLANVWSDTSNTTVAALAEINKKGKDVTVQTKDQENAVKAADKAYVSFKEKISTAGAEMQLQISNGEKLTKTQQVLAQLTANNTNEVMKLSEARRQELITLAQATIALEKQADAQEEARKATEKLTKEINTKNQTLDTEIQRQLESNEKLRDGESASVALEVAKLREAAATAQKNAVTAEETNQSAELTAEYKKQADKLLELADLKEQGVHLEMAKQAADEWKKITESIENGLTDSLMRAFESGKGFADAFKTTLINAFKTMILKPTISAVLGGVFGGGSMAANAGGVGGGGGLMGGIGNLVSMGKSLYSFMSGGAMTSLSDGIVSLGAKLGSGWLQDFGGSMAGGASPFAVNGTASMLGQYAGKAIPIVGGYMIGNGINSAISGEYKTNSTVMGLEKIGTAVASAFFGPVGGAVVGAIGGVINRAFGMGPKKISESGIEGSFGGGDASGQTYANWKKKGGWFRSDKRGTDIGALDDQMSQSLDSGAMAVYQQTLAWAEALKLPAEKLASVTSNFKVQLTEDSEANQEAIAKIFNDYQDTLAGKFSTLLSPFQRAGETMSDTLGRLANLQAFSEGFNEFGGVFSRIASLSVDAREQLIGFAGGIDALMGKTQSFIDAYYTDAEKAGLQSKQVASVLKDLGVDPSTLQTRDQYRALVESQNVNTEQGRQMFAALLDIAPAFAGLADYLTQNKLTLDQAAAQAPQTAVLQSLFDQQSVDTAQMVDQQTLTNQNLVSIEDAVRSGNGLVASTIERLMGSMTEAYGRALAGQYSESRAVVPA